MIEPLLARLNSRITFVVGKGGVGKTTSAAGIALALADRSESTHLISTDPAHSLSDLFAHQTSSCSKQLTVEEFDARAYAEMWFARIQPNLITLVSNGSYLDETDARGFLDLSLPGIDEVMAALRLVDLLATDTQRIVVDTAPTGHTLRLLESARVLRSWVTAGRALSAKARAVAQQLLRQAIRFPADDTLDEVEGQARAFQDNIVQSAAFVMVTRAGHVVAAETERLQAELRQRGAHVVATLTDRTTSPTDDVFVTPRLVTTTGCAALRIWAKGLSRDIRTTTPVAQDAARGDAAAYIADLPARLIMVAGKGGVGKSTCAAAIAMELAASRKVCLVSTDPAGSLGEVLDTRVQRAPTAIDDRLWARQIDANAELEQMRRQYRDRVESVFASLGLETAAQLDRRVIETLFEFAPPGIDEIVALLEIMECAPDYDVMVIDSAPTGHFLRLLEMPDIALQWLHALMRLLVKYHAIASLDALGQDLLAFSKRLRQLKLDLTATDATALFVVTLTEPVVVAETQRLRMALERAHVPIAGIILNRAEADADAAHAARAVFTSERLIRAPDAGTEVSGPPALRSFLSRWEIIGE